MSYITRLQMAIDFIESHLRDEISLLDVADAASFSAFHFHRIFSSTVGEGVAEYIRRRRLTEAANELVNTKKRVIDIAIDYRFESQESFTRAFKKAFHSNPAEFRKLNVHSSFYKRKILTEEVIVHRMKNIEVKPDLIFKDSFWVVGMEYQGPIKPQHDLWQKFVTRIAEIKGRPDEVTAFGVCYSDREMIKRGELSYLAAVPVVDTKDIPTGMVAKQVPAGYYAVVTHKGPISKITDSVEYVFGTWLPKSGYEPEDRPDLELYDHRFKMEAEDSELDILVPVKKTN